MPLRFLLTVFQPTQLGLGLIEGYKSLRLQLEQPTLRAAMERDMSGIADGTQRKADVVARHVQSMRQMFVTATADASRLERQMSRYLGVLSSYVSSYYVSSCYVIVFV
jgi:DNA topoisomerase-3